MMETSPAWLWLLAAVIVAVRFPKEPRPIVVLRYIIGFFVGWWAFNNYVVQEHDRTMAITEAEGDNETLIADTGAGAMVLILGWMPALIYIAIVDFVRFFLVRRAAKLFFFRRRA